MSHKTIFLLLVLPIGLALFFLHSLCFAQESMTISTYYPSPYGSYNELQTDKMAIGDTNGDGSLDSLDMPQVSGQLYTARSVIYKPQNPLPATEQVEGELVYNLSDKSFYFYNGSAWVKQSGSGGGCYVSYSGGCLAGFTNKGSAGSWGACTIGAGPSATFLPPGGSCPATIGGGCCQYSDFWRSVCVLSIVLSRFQKDSEI